MLKKLKKYGKKLSVLLLKLVLVLFLASLGVVLLYKYINPPLTPLMVIRYFENGAGIEKKWKSYEDISDNMKIAVIAAEDQKFPSHGGFDLESIQDAIVDRLEGDELRGASTISQQTAKNVFLWPGRSWVRKGAEAYFTFLIETVWSKKRILEVYLNVIETGDGIYGVESASRTYFGKPASELNAREAALITVSLPNPRLMSPGQPSEYMNRRMIWITGQMQNLGGGGYLREIEK